VGRIIILWTGGQNYNIMDRWAEIILWTGGQNYNIMDRCAEL
jgi:hypothetical protein